MRFCERLRATGRLWPYMLPLFVVYFAEYAMQSGTWTAVGEGKRGGKREWGEQCVGMLVGVGRVLGERL
jgi:hypothetical protein